MENNSILTIGRALGLFPFDKNGHSMIRLVRYSVVVNVVNFLFIFLVRFYLHVEPVRNTTVVLSYIKFFLLCFSVIYHVVTAVQFKDDIHFILRTLERCNDWAPIENDTHFLFSLFFMDTVEILTLIALHFMSPPATNAVNRTLSYLLFPYLSILETLIILQCIIFASAVLRVRANLDASPSGISSIRKHFALYRVCQKIDAIYGVPVLLAVAQDFVVVVQVLSLYFYKILQLALFSNSAYGNLWVLVMFLKVFNFTLKFFLIVICFDKVKKQMDVFVFRIFREFQMTDRFSNRQNAIEQYLHMKPFVEFTAARFFDMNYSIILSMLAAAMTYLTIIVDKKFKV